MFEWAWRAACALALVPVLLAACGQKGALYLPDRTASAVSRPAAPSPPPPAPTPEPPASVTPAPASQAPPATTHPDDQKPGDDSQPN
ncbi:MAG TPA: lipoprotein [Steroidobacteraceae bacterium]|nr:lipoprotein [Steroidobacteraceae bacterium]